MGAKVLLLEDDVPLALEMRAALAQIGCTVEVLRDGNAGLARATSSSFDLIIASVELPGMNGFRLANRLKKDPKHFSAPIFLLTSQSDSAFDEHRKLPTRADSYFQKPILSAELVARVRANVPSLGGAGSGTLESSEASSASEADVLDDLLDALEMKDDAGAASTNGPRIEGLPTQVDLGARVANLEKRNIELDHELDEARALVANAEAAKSETALRLGREVAHWKARADVNSKPSVAPPANLAHEELAHREHLFRKDAKISQLKKDLEREAHAQRELKEKIARIEGDLPILKQALADLGHQNAEMEKHLSAARADKEQATRRAADLSRRLERVRPDIELAEQNLALEQADRERGAAENARTLAESAAQREADRSRSERLHAEELAARGAAHAREMREACSVRDSEIQRLKHELAEVHASLESERALAAQREETQHEELLNETRRVRAEHVEALAVAEQSFSHKQTVLRHEFEASHATLREHARRRILEAQEKLVESTRGAAQRVAEIEQRSGADIIAERHRSEELERALVAERAARADELAGHASAMAEVGALRQRERVEAEARELAFRSHASQAAAEHARAHLDELDRIAAEHDRVVEELRRALGDAEGRRASDVTSAVVEVRESARREHSLALDQKWIEHEEALALAEARFAEQLANATADRDAAAQRAVEMIRESDRQAQARLAARERELEQARLALEDRYLAEMAVFDKTQRELRDAIDAERMGRAADATAHAAKVTEIALATNAELGQHLEAFRAEHARRETDLKAALEEQYQQESSRERQAFETKLEALQREVDEVRAAGERDFALAEGRWQSEKDVEVRSKVQEVEAAHARVLADLERVKQEELAQAQRKGDDGIRAAEENARTRVRETEAERDARVRELEQTIARLEQERERKQAEADRVREASGLALEAERAARAADLETHQEKLAAFAAAHEAELGEIRHRTRDLEALHAATMRARDGAAGEELARERADREKDVAALREQLEHGQLDAERARTDAAAAENRMREEAEAKERALAADHADALAAAARRFEAQLSEAAQKHDIDLASLREESRQRTAKLEADIERRTNDAREAALRNAASAESARDLAIAGATALLEERVREQDQAMTALRAEHAEQMANVERVHGAALAEARHAHEAALAVERDRAKREMSEEVAAKFEREVGQAMEELRTELEVERAQTFGQMERAHSAALRRVMENGERELAALVVRVRELEQALARSENAGTPEAQAATRDVDASGAIERLEALVRSRTEDVVSLERELDEARATLPALEGEVAALRMDLTSMRLQLDAQVVLARMSKDELERKKQGPDGG